MEKKRRRINLNIILRFTRCFNHIFEYICNFWWTNIHVKGTYGKQNDTIDIMHNHFHSIFVLNEFLWRIFRSSKIVIGSNIELDPELLGYTTLFNRCYAEMLELWAFISSICNEGFDCLSLNYLLLVFFEVYPWMEKYQLWTYRRKYHFDPRFFVKIVKLYLNCIYQFNFHGLNLTAQVDITSWKVKIQISSSIFYIVSIILHLSFYFLDFSHPISKGVYPNF